MVVPEVERGFVLMKKCSVSDHVCYGREEGESDYFFMYSTFFTDVHVRLPFDEFTMGVLLILNVAPPNCILIRGVIFNVFGFSVKCLVSLLLPNRSFTTIVLGLVTQFARCHWSASLGVLCFLLILFLTSVLRLGSSALL